MHKNIDNVKNTILLNDWKEAGEELANGLKSYLHNSEQRFQSVGECKNE